MTKALLTLALVAVALAPARADDLRPPPSTDAASMRADDDVPQVKSPWVAAGLSTGLTALGAALLIAPAITEPGDALYVTSSAAGAALLLIGPSTGSLYVGRRDRATAMIAARAGTLLLGVAIEAGTTDSDELFGSGLGFAVVAFSAVTVADLVWAPIQARDYNRKTALRSLQVAPMLGGADGASGAMVAGTF